VEKLKSLDRFQKGLLILMLGLALVFAVIYPVTLSRVGYSYNDAILVPSQENGNTLYSGRIKGREVCFTVSEDTVVLQYGEKTYGPYTLTEDPSAVPEEHELSERMTGLEVRENEEVLFRGGVMDFGNFPMLYSEDGSMDGMAQITYMTSDGIERDADGNPYDRMKPSVNTLYELTHGPELTHKGHGFAWFGAVFLCILNAVSILFAEELFRWNLSLQIRNAEHAEPTDWELSKRYVGWIAPVILALVIFIMGLR